MEQKYVYLVVFECDDSFVTVGDFVFLNRNDAIVYLSSVSGFVTGDGLYHYVRTKCVKRVPIK